MASTTSLPTAATTMGDGCAVASTPVTLVLNGTTLTLNSKGRWEMQSNDLELATMEIDRLLNEKERLCSALSLSLQQVDDLKQEVEDLNKIKSTTLELVSELC